MKQTFYSILSLVLLAGCSSEMPYQSSLTEERVPLVISSIRIDSDVSTRTNDIPLEEGILGIFQIGDIFYTSAAFRYVGNGGSWLSTPPLTLGPDETSVCAWFPYNYFSPSTTDDLAHCPMSAQIYSHEGNLAFLPTTGGLDKQHPQLNIRLTHAYGLLNFTLHKDVTYKGDGRVTGITLKNDRIVRTEMMDIRDGSFSDQDIVTSLALDTVVTVTNDKAPTIKILVPPQTFVDTELELEVDGKTLRGTFSAGAIGELQSGGARTFNVTLRRKLELSVSVLPPDGSAGGEIIW